MHEGQTPAQAAACRRLAEAVADMHVAYADPGLVTSIAIEIEVEPSGCPGKNAELVETAMVDGVRDASNAVSLERGSFSIWDSVSERGGKADA